MENTPPRCHFPPTLAFFAEIGDGGAFKGFVDFARGASDGSITFTFDSGGIVGRFLSRHGDFNVFAILQKENLPRYRSTGRFTFEVVVANLSGAIAEAKARTSILILQKTASPEVIHVRISGPKAPGDTRKIPVIPAQEDFAHSALPTAVMTVAVPASQWAESAAITARSKCSAQLCIWDGGLRLGQTHLGWKMDDEVLTLSRDVKNATISALSRTMMFAPEGSAVKVGLVGDKMLTVEVLIGCSGRAVICIT